MTGPPTAFEGGSTIAESHPRDRAVPLEATVVRYANQADRCTIAPPTVTGTERLTTWLTADLDAFVQLEDVR